MDSPVDVLWRRLDGPGHDACRFAPSGEGWRLCGTAVFLQSTQVCQLRYEVVTDGAFCTRRATVSGWCGSHEIGLRIEADRRGNWWVDDAEQPQLAGCIDLDLGFTPATNFLPINRLDLAVGEEAQAPAAYLAFPQLRFLILAQRYRRLSSLAYEYEAPGAGYRDVLAVSGSGVIRHYPGLFDAEGAHSLRFGGFGLSG